MVGQYLLWRVLLTFRLTPYESINTDVVLLGYSMGGLVAAELALMRGNSSGRSLQHNVLGVSRTRCSILGHAARGPPQWDQEHIPRTT